MPTPEEQLIRACIKGDLAQVEELVGQGTSVDSRWQSSTGLMWAAMENHADVVDYLLGQGADINLLHMQYTPRSLYIDTLLYYQHLNRVKKSDTNAGKRTHVSWLQLIWQTRTMLHTTRIRLLVQFSEKGNLRLRMERE